MKEALKKLLGLSTENKEVHKIKSKITAEFLKGQIGARHIDKDNNRMYQDILNTTAYRVARDAGRIR